MVASSQRQPYVRVLPPIFTLQPQRAQWAPVTLLGTVLKRTRSCPGYRKLTLLSVANTHLKLFNGGQAGYVHSFCLASAHMGLGAGGLMGARHYQWIYELWQKWGLCCKPKLQTCCSCTARAEMGLFPVTAWILDAGLESHTLLWSQQSITVQVTHRNVGGSYPALCGEVTLKSHTSWNKAA